MKKLKKHLWLYSNHSVGYFVIVIEKTLDEVPHIDTPSFDSLVLQYR